MKLFMVDEPSIEELLAGEHIRAEFCDTRINSPLGDSDGCLLDHALTEATKTARSVVDKNPLFIFGPTGVGKSTLTNALLTHLGETSLPADSDHLRPCTRGVKVYQCDGETKAGKGRVLFFDTEGWELHNAAPILRLCLEKAKENGLLQEVLHNRLVLILVTSGNAESQRMLDSPKFKKLVGQLCNQFARLKGRHTWSKPVLLPVVTQIDKVDPKDRDSIIRNVITKMEESVTGIVDFKKPICVSSTKGENIDVLAKELFDIFNTQLQSRDILNVVRRFIETDLQMFLRMWSNQYQGLEADSALIRRHVWSVARSYGFRVGHIEQTYPIITWDRAMVAREHVFQMRDKLARGYIHARKANEQPGCFSFCFPSRMGPYETAGFPAKTLDEKHMDSLRQHIRHVEQVMKPPALAKVISNASNRELTPPNRRGTRTPMGSNRARVRNSVAPDAETGVLTPTATTPRRVAPEIDHHLSPRSTHPDPLAREPLVTRSELPRIKPRASMGRTPTPSKRVESQRSGTGPLPEHFERDDSGSGGGTGQERTESPHFPITLPSNGMHVAGSPVDLETPRIGGNPVEVPQADGLGSAKKAEGEAESKTCIDLTMTMELPSTQVEKSRPEALRRFGGTDSGRDSVQRGSSPSPSSAWPSADETPLASSTLEPPKITIHLPQHDNDADNLTQDIAEPPMATYVKHHSFDPKGAV
eukprot:CAMPEP_0194494014 /NCGR_PEP_ID=MMETSP0253-20130528/12052_1 /TAXON_ID=2966 /ORGANISM="Noctiluca scintillans" /LENGTH=701 /DNA_ID=CAMNT_0039335065 /DNA_START=122 /DNA_END=2227 /DNA_ORIENTATION=+